MKYNSKNYRDSQPRHRRGRRHFGSERHSSGAASVFVADDCGKKFVKRARGWTTPPLINGGTRLKTFEQKRGSRKKNRFGRRRQLLCQLINLTISRCLKEILQNDKLNQKFASQYENRKLKRIRVTFDDARARGRMSNDVNRIFTYRLRSGKQQFSFLSICAECH